jgi:SOS-response transcriptional repressor LexA
MTEPGDRLREAREAAGFETATDAARTLGVEPPTYLAHENCSRGFRRASADKYARKFGVSLEWLLTGRGRKQRIEAARPPQHQHTVSIVGYVAAGSAAHFSDAGELGRVIAPEGSTENTVAVEIRGESLGSFFDRWIIFYDDVRRPVTPDLIGKLCVVGTEDGRVLVKKLRRSKTHGRLYHLESQTEAPIFDVAVEWAARVKLMAPQ